MIRPCVNKIIVKKQSEGTTSEGIILTNMGASTILGEVIEVGPLTIDEKGKEIPVKFLKKGDTVAVENIGLTKLDCIDSKLLVAPLSQVIGVLDG